MPAFPELPLPAAAGPGLLPLAQGPSPGPEAPEPPHQRPGRYQASGLWPGKSLWSSRSHLHT